MLRDLAAVHINSGLLESKSRGTDTSVSHVLKNFVCCSNIYIRDGYHPFSTLFFVHLIPHQFFCVFFPLTSRPRCSSIVLLSGLKKLSAIWIEEPAWKMKLLFSSPLTEFRGLVLFYRLGTRDFFFRMHNSLTMH